MNSQLKLKPAGLIDKLKARYGTATEQRISTVKLNGLSGGTNTTPLLHTCIAAKQLQRSWLHTDTVSITMCPTLTDSAEEAFNLLLEASSSATVTQRRFMWPMETKTAVGRCVFTKYIVATANPLPTMCGGATIHISVWDGYSDKFNPHPILTGGMHTGSVRGGSSSNVSGWQAVRGYKGQIVLVFEGIAGPFPRLPEELASTFMRSMLASDTTRRPATTTSHHVYSELRWASSTVALIGTQYLKDVSGETDHNFDSPQDTADHMKDVDLKPVGSAADGWMRYSQQKIVAKSGSNNNEVPYVASLFCGYGTHRKDNRIISRTETIRENIRSHIGQQLALSMRVDKSGFSDKTAPLVITDNAKPTAYSGIKTCDVIGWLSDPVELRKLGTILKKVALRAGKGVGTRQQLVFTQFAAANNPNESGHVIVGGCLSIQNKYEWRTLPASIAVDYEEETCNEL